MIAGRHLEASEGLWVANVYDMKQVPALLLIDLAESQAYVLSPSEQLQRRTHWYYGQPRDLVNQAQLRYQQHAAAFRRENRNRINSTPP